MDIKFDCYFDLLRPENTYGNPSFHKFYEIVYYKDGSGFTTIVKKYKYTPGTYAIILPNQLHDEERIRNTNLSVVNFTVEDNIEKLPSALFYDSNRSVIRCIEKIQKEFITISPLSEKFLNIYCAELYFTILRNFSDTGFTKDRIDYIIRYIEEFYNDNISVSELADISGYSCRHFRELFKSRTGLSPSDFIFQKRLNLAKQLLEQSNESIVNICQTCGFTSSSQFAFLFKRYTGKTPKEYRNKFTTNIYK